MMGETHTAEDQACDLDVRALKKQRGIAKGRFTTKVKAFNYCQDKGVPVQVLEDVFSEICVILAKIETINEQIIQATDDEALIAEHLNYIDDLLVIKCDAHSSLVLARGQSPNQTLQSHQQANSNCKMLIKKIEPPIFYGDVREFPTFVKDFTRLVIAHHGKDPFILRQSLQAKAREAVGRLDDFDLMWDRLNERFGSSAKVVDAVLGEICALKPIPEGNKSKLIAMINVVEQAWIDLKKIGKLNEINNSTSLTKVERLLPEGLKREWTHKARSLNDCEKFEQLIKFLTEERQAIEYMEDESRLAGVGAKASVSLTTSNNDQEGAANLSEAISKLSLNQETSQKQILDCFANLSHALLNIANQNQTYASNNGISVKGCWFHGTSSHGIEQCTTFGKLDDVAKMDHLKRVGVCFTCLEPSHISRNCDKRTRCNVKVRGNEICGRMHHPMLHSLFVRETQPLKALNNFANGDGTLLMMSKINSGSHKLSTFFDPGSTLTIITHEAASKLGLRGSEISLSITKIGNQTVRIESKIYKVPLIDDNGKEWLVNAAGIEEITSEVDEVDLTEIASVLGVHPWQIQRPTGKVELLIGTDYCVLFPRVVKTVGDLQLMYSPFGYCVRGCPNPLADNVDEIQVRVNHMTCVQIDDCVIKSKADVRKTMESFFMTEELGVACSPQCGGCRCGKCSLKGYLTLKEEREVKLIDEGLKYDELGRCWIAEYPWIRDPNELPNNISVAHARLISTEKRLNKLGHEYSIKYREQMQDMVDRGVARKLTDRERLAYGGPVFYLPHHEVHKLDSKSTPLRIVFNSSAPYMGFTLNDFLAKGPDCLSNMLGVLLRFRQGFIGLMGDIRKMYNSVKISLLDQNCHRFLWRDMNTERSPDHYVLTTVTFGDRPSGAIAMVALRKTARMTNDCPKATNLIENDSYVDDLLTSVDDFEAADTIVREIDQVLQRGGFQIKEWVISGVHGSRDLHPSIIETEREKVLGLNWNPKSDLFFFKVRLNFSKKIRKLLIEPDLTRDRIEEELPLTLTKRMILRQIASIYDPLGLITPFTLKAKLLMRELVLEMDDSNKGLGWDDAISPSSYAKWKALFREMFDLESLTFIRCLKPHNAVGNPDLVIFADGSTKAYGAVAYARWKCSDDSATSRLIASKSRIAPARQMTIPRLELCGSVLACRLRNFIEHEMGFSFNSVTHIIDSEIVRSQIQKESFRFNTFVANRVAEIQEKTRPDEWYWVNSELNIADWTTRGCKPDQLNDKSIWQLGPTFLSLHMDEWPVSQKCSVKLPDVLYAKPVGNLCTTISAVSVIDISRFNDYDQLLNVTARILTVARDKSLLALNQVPEAGDLYEAEMHWVRIVQKDIDKEWKVRYQRLGPNLNKEGIITVGARLSKWLKTNWNRDDYILLIPNHPFTKLYIQHLHKRDHSGVESTLVKLQTKYWVPGARRIIKQVKASCVMCRRIDKVCETQCMGLLPDERLTPAPSFFRTSLDLFGPYWVKDTVKRRTKMKVYGVIFTCMLCRAVYLDIAEGYDTEHFLRVFRRFISIRGVPGLVYSDRGSQLVKANKELNEAVENLNFSEITKFGRKEGLTWKFTKGADAPWENGCSESLIRLVKRGINMSIGDQILPFGELQTVLFEIANLINERPIGIKPGMDINLGSYLSPNDLLLGRASSRVPIGVFDNDCSFDKNFKYVNEIVNAFWRRWMRDFFPTLIVRAKWHVDKRNVMPGDIVLVKDKNALRGSWKLAQVVTATPGSDNRVRNVSLRYKPLQPGSNYKGQKDILIDRSIHSIIVLLPIEEQ